MRPYPSETPADRLKSAFSEKGTPPEEPIKLQIDEIGQAKADFSYRKKIEKLFVDAPYRVGL